MCLDKNKSISQTKFCDGKKDCPDGDDENTEICEASNLLKKLSYIISYPLILILVVSYFVLPKIHYNQSVVKKISIEFGIKKTNVKALQETAARKDEFITKYKKAHSNLSEMKMLVDEMKYDLYKKGNKGNQQEVSSWVKEIEDELHNNAEERYQCILTYYKASHPLIDKIADPEGGILGKIGKLGLNLNCLLLFVLLLFHIFDYVKDIDVTEVIYHYDITVLQQVYEQYKGFNFFHLFLTSLGLLFVSHIFNAIYWLLIRHKVAHRQGTQPTYKKKLWNNLPLIPLVLPILLFCRRVELIMATESPYMEKVAWVAAIEELNVLQRMANDVKIIEVVFELFGQMVIQIILILRFQWLVSKPDIKGFGFSFGVSFKTYMLVTMGISFFSGIIPALFTYHRRNRENVRPYASLSSVFIILMWNLVFITKLLVYIIGFQNTPILFWVPVIAHMFLAFLLLTKYEPEFGVLEKHDKLIHVFASFLVPISLPCDKQASMAKVYGISLLTFCLECFSILSFAILMNNFYSDPGFKEANAEFPHLLNLGMFVSKLKFDHLCYLTAVLVVVVTLISSALIYLYSRCFHPRTKMFRSVSKPEEKNSLEMNTESESRKAGVNGDNV